MIVLGLGLAITVSPLTAAILGAADPARSGIASAVNNAVARVAGLLAVASLSAIIGSAVDLSGLPPHRACHGGAADSGSGRFGDRCAHLAQTDQATRPRKGGNARRRAGNVRGLT